MENLNAYKSELGLRWVRTTTGDTWICPIDAVKGLENPTDEQLRTLCVNESENPENA